MTQASIEPLTEARLDGLIALVVAVVREQVAGAIQVQSDGLIQAHVSMLLIGQDWRGAGLGSTLLREGLERAGGLQLDVRTRTEGYYERLGASRSLGFRLTRENLGLRGADV
jgi:ribosomal protein S18 acetylase RimI-like enzyme